MEERIKLGLEISKIRTEVLKLTQKELADKLQITPVYISFLEMGKKTPSIDFLKNLYELTSKKEVPSDIKDLLLEIKRKAKKEITESKIIRLLDDQSENSEDIYDTLELLAEKGKIEEAKKLIFKTLANMESINERKLLEAIYYQMVGNIPISIKLLKEISELIK